MYTGRSQLVDFDQLQSSTPHPPSHTQTDSASSLLDDEMLSLGNIHHGVDIYFNTMFCLLLLCLSLENNQ